jgi:alpha-tubulin suppressor-like RCC1 family protein
MKWKYIKTHNLLKISIFILILCVGIVLSAGAKGCNSKTANTAVGSSISTFRINAPSSLTATAVFYSQINMTWQDNSDNEDGFEIERRTLDTPYSLLATISADIISYSDNELLPFTYYYYRVLALNTIGDRSVWSNEANMRTLNLSWIAVTAGGAHTFALTTDGKVWSWGRNDVGQLGLADDTYSNRFTPSLIESSFDWAIFEDIAAVDAGFFYSCALKSNQPASGLAGGTIWSWGNNAYGQLGQGNTNSYYAPVQIGTDSDWIQISAGESHTAGLKTSGTLWLWGSNNNGQLGDGTTNDRLTPIQIGMETDWSIVQAGWADSISIVGYTIALKVNQTFWSWGNNEYGQLGDGTTDIRTSPRQIGVDSDWWNITSGRYHTIGLKTNGTLWAWGRNDSGQLGRANTIIPGQVGTNSDWAQVTSGAYHTFGLKVDGTLWAWGNNEYGQLGDGTTTNKSSPLQVGIDSDWSQITGGLWHSLGIKTNRTLLAWGRNYLGRLGLGDMVDRVTPTLVGN